MSYLSYLIYLIYLSEVCSSGIEAVRPILMQSDRWGSKKGGFRSETKSGTLTQSKKCLFDPNFFNRASRSSFPAEKVGVFNGMCRSDCWIEKVFEAHRISHHPTKHTITPYNSSDAGLTATVLLLLLLCSLWRLSTKSNAATATMKRVRASRAPNERFARGRGATKTCA